MMDIQKKSKGGTIAQAILAVMNAEKRALISQEICQLILEKNFYHFNTKIDDEDDEILCLACHL